MKLDSEIGAAAPQLRRTDAALRTSQAILAELLGPPERRAFDVRYWDAAEEAGRRPDGGAGFTLVLSEPGALRRILLPPTERNVAEAFIHGHLEVEGDLEAAVGALAPALARPPSGRSAGRLARWLRSLPGATEPPAGSDDAEPARRPFRGRWLATRHSRRRDRRAVRYHYDIGNDFYALWLDRRMVYSCAYFDQATGPLDAALAAGLDLAGVRAAGLDLDAAQEAKLDLICRKLRLRPGERLLDIGCGWGGLIVYAAERFGVHATGITLSERQAEFARDAIAAAGLDGRCRIEVRDYRELPPGDRFDKIASIGMVEHVGRSRLREYYGQAFRLLEPGGLLLNQGIVTLDPAHSPAAKVKARIQRRWTSFIEHYVFPDAQLLGPITVLDPAERAGFELRDVENLREHYALTLRCWLLNLEANRERAVELAGQDTYRVWRLYLAGCAHQFAAGRIGVLQTLLARRDATGRVAMPMTRTDLYRT